jgi:hypothetical protein
LKGNRIEAGSIGTDQLDAGIVTTDKLDAKAVTADKIAVDAITANMIAADSTFTQDLKIGQYTYLSGADSNIQVKDRNGTRRLLLGQNMSKYDANDPAKGYGMYVYASDGGAILTSDDIDGTYIRGLTVGTSALDNQAVTRFFYSQQANVNTGTIRYTTQADSQTWNTQIAGDNDPNWQNLVSCPFTHYPFGFRLWNFAFSHTGDEDFANIHTSFRIKVYDDAGNRWVYFRSISLRQQNYSTSDINGSLTYDDISYGSMVRSDLTMDLDVYVCALNPAYVGRPITFVNGGISVLAMKK